MRSTVALCAGGFFAVCMLAALGLPPSTSSLPYKERDGTQQGPQWQNYSNQELAAASDPHLFRGQPVCQLCHKGSSPALLSEQRVLCAQCHDFEHGNHPVGVVQALPVADPLPLGTGRMVLCHTCHDSHDVHSRRAGLRMEFTPLCKSCHQSH